MPKFGDKGDRPSGTVPADLAPLAASAEALIKAEARRQALAVANSASEADDQTFVDSISDLRDR